MPFQVRWFGLSLVLHLALGTAFIIAAPRSAERTPRVISVTLEDPSMPQLPHTAADTATRRPPDRPTLPVRLPPADTSAALAAETESHPQPQHPEPLLIPAAAQSAEQSPSMRTQQHTASAPATTAASVSGEKPAAAPPAAEERLTPEKTRQRYLKEHFAYIRDMISRRLVYPPMARKMGWSGRAAVSFLILEDGTVQNIRITESSGFPVLDKSALETVRQAAPFPRPPVRAEITVPVSFRMMP